MDVNEITLLGSIKEISNLKNLKGGYLSCWLLVETNVSYIKKDGEIGNEKTLHRVISYGKYASSIKKNASIDQKIYIQGKMKTNEHVINNVSFQKTFVITERFKLYPKIEETYTLEDLGYEPDNGEEVELKFNNDYGSGYFDEYDDYSNDLDIVEYLDEMGWNYEENNN